MTASQQPDLHTALRHYLSTIAYRLDVALNDAPDEFNDYSPGNDVRSPGRILHHIVGVLNFAQSLLDPGHHKTTLPQRDFHADHERAINILREMDHYLSKHPELPIDALETNIQGPLSDVLTHIGQLTLLRRLYGSPVHSVVFPKAKVPPLNE